MNCSAPDEFIGLIKKRVEQYPDLLAESLLPVFECVLYQLEFNLQEKEKYLENPLEKSFVLDLLAKLINEGWGLVACIKQGAFIASYHHSRACIELCANFYYVFSNTKKRTERINKYSEFTYLSQYNLYEAGDELALQRISASQFKEWKDEKKPHWIRLYKPKDDLNKVRNWHDGSSTISQMLEELPNGSLKSHYDYLCHATHLSPLTVTLSRGRYTSGLPEKNGKIDITLINRALIGGLGGIGSTIKYVKDYLNIDLDVEVPNDTRKHINQAAQ